MIARRIGHYSLIGEFPVDSAGAYGRIFKVNHQSGDEIFVLKQVPFETLNEKDRRNTLQEVEIMEKIRHPNIVRYRESFMFDGQLNIVMEYASGGDLGVLIEERRRSRPLDEDMLWTFLLQIVQGLKHLHDQRILHRDIKPKNIFLDAFGNIKIGDLGLGRILDDRSQTASYVGTPLYMSPEICSGDPYDYKSDIWALGCLMYELATLKPPFSAGNTIALAKKIVSVPPEDLPEGIYSEQFRFLIGKMLEKRPELRPNTTALLEYAGCNDRASRIQNDKMSELTEELAYKEKTILDLQFKLEISRNDVGLLQTSLAEAQCQFKETESMLLDALQTERETVADLQSKLATRSTERCACPSECTAREARLAEWEVHLKRQELEFGKNISNANLQLIQSGLDPLQFRLNPAFSGNIGDSSSVDSCGMNCEDEVRSETGDSNHEGHAVSGDHSPGGTPIREVSHMFSGCIIDSAHMKEQTTSSGQRDFHHSISNSTGMQTDNDCRSEKCSAGDTPSPPCEISVRRNLNDAFNSSSHHNSSRETSTNQKDESGSPNFTEACGDNHDEISGEMAFSPKYNRTKSNSEIKSRWRRSNLAPINLSDSFDPNPRLNTPAPIRPPNPNRRMCWTSPRAAKRRVIEITAVPRRLFLEKEKMRHFSWRNRGNSRANSSDTSNSGSRSNSQGSAGEFIHPSFPI
eukprot:177075_1